MKSGLDQLANYAAYHRDRRNIATHLIGVPMIVFAVVILLTRPEVECYGVHLTPAVAANLPKEKFDTIRTELQTEMTSSVALGTSVLVPIAHNCPFNLDSGATYEWPSSFKNNQFLVVGSVDNAGTLSNFSGRGGTTRGSPS